MMSMWEYEEAQRQAHEEALLAGFNFPHSPQTLAKVESELLARKVQQSDDWV